MPEQKPNGWLKFLAGIGVTLLIGGAGALVQYGMQQNEVGNQGSSIVEMQKKIEAAQNEVYLLRSDTAKIPDLALQTKQNQNEISAVKVEHAQFAGSVNAQLGNLTEAIKTLTLEVRKLPRGHN